MFDRWKDKRARRKIERELTRAIRTARAEDAQTVSHMVDGAVEHANFELEMLRLRALKRESNRLWDNALHLDIEIPFGDGQWEETPQGQVMSTATRLQLRRAIDEERTRRREVAAWWWRTIVLPAMTTLIGILGATTGLVALLRRH